MEWLQKIYMLTLNPIYDKTCILTVKVREKIFFGAMFCLYGSVLIWYSINMFGIYFSHTPRMFFEAGMFFIGIIFVSEKKLEKVKWNRLVATCWILCGIVIFLMGFIAKQNYGYWLIGPIMAFAFPCLYFVLLNQNDYSKYIEIICKAIILASVIYFIFALFADFIGGEAWDYWGLRYKGTTSDANRLGEICVASFACGIYLFMSTSRLLWKTLSALNIAFCMCNGWLSVSRSTLLAILCMLIMFIILVVKDMIVTKDWKKAFIRLISIACCICIAFVGTYAMKDLHGYAMSMREQVNIEQDKGETSSAVSDDATGNLNSRIDTSSKDIDTYSSGRISIWKDYFNHVRIIGNPADGKTPISENRTVVSAHNTLLEFSYRSGIVAGLLFLIIEFLSGIHILKTAFRRKGINKEQDIFLSFVSIGFIIVSNLQVAYNPLTSIIFLVYSIAMTVMFEEKRIEIE